MSTQAVGAHGLTLKTLHIFCQQDGCPDGNLPSSGLLLDPSGILYGTAHLGGKFDNSGRLYALTPKDGKYSYGAIYDFCLHTGCSDGSAPGGNLIQDKDGNLYGTTQFGGTQSLGVAYELMRKKHGWQYTVLYNFCAQSSCTDGANPSTGLSYEGQADGKLWNKTSPLYGTASGGGANGTGAIFQLKRDGAQWTYTVVHDLINGSSPNPVLVDRHGNLFVTNSFGGAKGEGNLSKLEKSTWKQTVLHIFCSEDNCADGQNPSGPLLLDKGGNIFGVTIGGGEFGHGEMFEYSASGNFTPDYSFCSLTDCIDGDGPNSLSRSASDDRFYGTAGGGKNQGGVVFSLALKNGSWNESVVHAFCPDGDCKTGQFPSSPIVQDDAGNLFGVTNEGGDLSCSGGVGIGCGTAFELKK